MALTEHDAQSAIDMISSGGWDALTKDYWWRGVMMKWSGLFRLRHGRDAPERFEARPHGPMTAAWYR